jgi:hypothetical protein
MSFAMPGRRSTKEGNGVKPGALEACTATEMLMHTPYAKPENTDARQNVCKSTRKKWLR